jgi:hypothetical protein
MTPECQGWWKRIELGPGLTLALRGSPALLPGISQAADAMGRKFNNCAGRLLAWRLPELRFLPDEQ